MIRKRYRKKRSKNLKPKLKATHDPMDPSFKRKSKDDQAVPSASPALQKAIDDYERTKKGDQILD